MEHGAAHRERQSRRALAQRRQAAGVRARQPRLGFEGGGKQVQATSPLREKLAGPHRPAGPRQRRRLPQHQDPGAAMTRKRSLISRRRFVGDVATGLTFTIVPPHVLGARGRGHNRLAPSDKLNIACIGVGGMGANDVRGVGKTENIYALCDVDERQGAQSFTAFPLAKRFKDFRVLLDKEGKSIDAVTVSTPDHTHTVAGMMAMKLGKHTRIQKPLARTLWEVKQLEDAARRYKVQTQMGNQGHAEEGTRLIREWVEAGLIGTVREIQLWTNRPIWPQAIERPLDEFYTPATLDWRDGSLYPPRPPEITDPNAWPFDTSGQLWIGDGGRLIAGIYGENPKLLDAAKQAEVTAHPVPQKYPRTEGVYAEWIAACKGGTPAGSSIPEHSGPLTEMVLLGNLAVRTAQPIDVNPQTGVVVTPGVPEEFLKPSYRQGWSW